MYKIAAFVAMIALVLGGCSWMNQKLGLQDDHPLEERLEEEIHDRTGLDLDLTPSSDESLDR